MTFSIDLRPVFRTKGRLGGWGSDWILGGSELGMGDVSGRCGYMFRKVRLSIPEHLCIV